MSPLIPLSVERDLGRAVRVLVIGILLAVTFILTVGVGFLGWLS